MNQEVHDLERVVEHLKEGRYNEIESSKHLSSDELHRLKKQLEDADQAREELHRENQRMKAEADKVG